MVVNPALLLVSAVFFLAMSAISYMVSWLAVSLSIRRRPRRVHRAGRNTLFLALIFPPFIAVTLTLGGAFLQHSHAPGHTHHSVYCGEIARLLTVPEGRIPILAGMIIQGTAWLVLLWGVWGGMCLLGATVSLKRALRPFLKTPSPKLVVALDRFHTDHGLGTLKFFEAEIPAARSCLVGIRHIHCVLSAELVAASTEEELAAVVLHEMNHYRAGDVWRTVVVGFLNCVFCYLRPLRLLSQSWREETELACDAATIVRTGDPLALASAILRVQGAPVKTIPLPTFVLGFAEEAACPPHKRVERLLAYANKEVVPAIDTLPARLWQWTITIGLAVSGVALLLTPQALCTAHCSLEAIARSLR